MDGYKVADFVGGIGATAKAFIDEDFKLAFAAGIDKRQAELYEKYTGHRVDILCEPGVYSYLDNSESMLAEADVIVGRMFSAFSQASAHRAEKMGMGKSRGQWDIVEKYMLQYRPKTFLLELNARFLNSIYPGLFPELSKEYNLSHAALPVKEYTGLPLRQMRVYVVGIRRELACPEFQFPEEVKLSVGWKDIFQPDKRAKNVYYIEKYDRLADRLEVGKLYKVSKEEFCQCDIYPTGLYERPVLRDYYGVREVTNNEEALLRGLTGFDFDEELPRREVLRCINTSANEYLFRRLARRIRLCLNHQEQKEPGWDERMIWNKLHWMKETSSVGTPIIIKDEAVDIAEESAAEKNTAEKIVQAETTQSESRSCDSPQAARRNDFQFPEAMKNISIFLSYCQKDGQLADSIDDHFRERGLELKRDKREIRAWRSIRCFMESIRNQDFVIMVITDNYLKSHNCMYEVLQVMEDKRYCERIFPLVMEGSIYVPELRIDYIRFWDEKCRLLEKKLNGISQENSVEGAEDLRKYKQIATTIAQFMKILSDMNNPPQDDYNQAVEAELRRYIQGRRFSKD